MQFEKHVDVENLNGMKDLVHSILVIMEANFKISSEAMSFMTSEQFGEYVADKVQAGDKDYQFIKDLVVAITNMKTDLGQKTAKLNKRMIEKKVEEGEINPLEVLFLVRELASSFVTYVMTISLESYHSMKMDMRSPETMDIETVIHRIDKRTVAEITGMDVGDLE